ncbi:MAG: tRNA (adenosine(37)-N6)-threonylcarbamoyltransferase complex transferase subunit TsaD [Candidatus Saccharibacteria bacterium]
MNILGIESSCDETAAAVVLDGRRILSNVVNSQIDIHAVYGGVVPEVAARSHIEVINPVINQALTDANMTWDDIDAIAVTYAPGLVGSLLVGTLAARALAVLKNKPLHPIHHVEAHVYANFLTKMEYGKWNMEDGKNNPVPIATPPEFPLLALIVSGGHSQLVLFRDHGDYELLGQTCDDAVGEAFDKVAKILGLPYPGGPSIARAAVNGDPLKYKLPKAALKCSHDGPHTGMGRKEQPSSTASRIEQYDERAAQAVTQRTAQDVCHYYDFSFSGLKTAVLRAVQHEAGVDISFPSSGLAARLDASQQNDFAASFQRTAIETLVDKTEKAFNDHNPKSVVIAGGVAANAELRRILSERLPINIDYAPMNLCTDNAAMVASLGYYQSQRQSPVDPFELEVQPSLSMTR